MIRTGLILSAISISLMAGISLWANGQLPADNIPVHWNANGVADRFASKSEAQFHLWLLPVASFLSAVLLAVLPNLEPMRENLLKSRKAYNVIWSAAMIMMLFLHAGICRMMVRTTGQDMASKEFARVVIAASAILFILIGNYLPKTRQNWFLGIRTPWTLSSEFTWEKTHRLAGRLFMLAGFISLIGAFVLHGISLVYMLLGVTGGAVLTSFIYSYLVYRGAPDKRGAPDYMA